MADSTFPSNLLELYQLNTLAGGKPSGLLGPDDLAYLQGALLSLQKLFLKHNKTPWSAQLAYVQEAVVPGDMLAIDLNRDATDENSLVVPYVGKFSTISNAGGGAIPVMIGLATVSAGSSSYCIYAGNGPVEARFTGLTPGQYSAGAKLTTDLTTNKLRLALVGEEVQAYFTPKGNILLLGVGRAA